MRLLLVILALTPFEALADTFLCVSEAAAMIEDGDGRRPASNG